MTGYALATALAAPVDEGMMLAEAAWTVVIRPCLMPNFSLIVLTSGARPLVVHEAHETTCMVAGAEMITFFAPASMCARHFGVSVKAPVDSQT